MSGYGEFSGAIDGLRGLEDVSPEYRHRALEVYAGTLDDGNVARAVELRAAPAGAGPAVGDTFSEAVQSWWSVSDAEGVVDLLRWGLDPRPWALVADDGEKTLATAWEALDDGTATAVVTAVGETLAAASAEGVTHGNLRPAHVLLPGGEPVARVDDWGLGRAVGEAAGGTFVTGFTAPEQLEGSTVDGEAVDTYGLAALAYFALTERPPFPEERAAVLGERPQPVSGFRPDLPDAVDDLVMRGLRRDPDERPVGPGTFAAEFEDAMAGGGTATGDTAAGGAGGAAPGSSGATAGAGAAAGDGRDSGDGSTSDGVAGAARGAAAGGAAAGGAADTGGTDGEDTGGGATGPAEPGGGGGPDDGGTGTTDSPVSDEPLAESDPIEEGDSGPLGDEGTEPLNDEGAGPLNDEDTDPLEGDDASPVGEEDPEPVDGDDSEPLGGEAASPLGGDSSATGGQRGAEPGSQPAGPTPEQPPPSPRDPSEGEQSPHSPPPREPNAEAEGGAAEPYPGDSGGEPAAPERTVGDRVNRRTVLAGGGLLAALAAVGAGAWAFLGGGSGGVDLSAVPDRAETVAAVDVAGLRESDALAGAVNARLPLSLPLLDAGTLAGVLDGVASRTGMDPADVQQAVTFAARSAGPGTYAGLVLDTGWDGSSLSSSLEEAGESLVEETHADSRLFVVEYADLPFPVAVGEVGEGRYAVGTRPEVEDVLETASGSTPSVGGRQVEAFRAAADGQVRLGSLLPSGLLSGAVPESVPEPVVAALTETARNVEYVSGSVGADGSARLRAETGSSEAAETAAAQLRAASRLAADELGGAGAEGALATLAGLLDEASVSQEGTTVTVSLSSAYEVLAASLAAAE